MKIAIASDHAGFSYKAKIIDWLLENGHQVEDFGTDTTEPCNYPDYIRPAALSVSQGNSERAIVLGGSGNGEAIVANRIPGVRCVLAWDRNSAELGRRHNDANVLSIGERMVSLSTAIEIVDIWLNSPFDGGRHETRVQQIDNPPDDPVS